KDAATRLRKESILKLVDIFRSLDERNGDLIFSGVGKSGIIAQKITSTFCSLGKTSYFLHPVEALHGDLGRIRPFDAVVFISKSGATEEILKLIPYLKINKSMMIGLLGNVSSLIAEKCALVFDCSVGQEACLNNQAPTSSSTLALAMGDAMAVIYEQITGLSKTGFASNHPAGLLGKALGLRVGDILCTRDKCPVLKEDSSLRDVILEMTKFPVGGCAVLDDKGGLRGIMVEGDIRRTFTSSKNGLDTRLGSLINRNPVVITPDRLAMDALELMERRSTPLNILPVVDEKNIFLGLVRLHDLLKEGFRIDN
ncbi:MAG: KpsF/GutQ family sugar-phosphate isomerase, partial [Halobacteriovoraceae bacterium]|nr:KpsF/GutQ family sugar-phosphate isomerase [Halobacteriovoraceae bacterium]